MSGPDTTPAPKAAAAAPVAPAAAPVTPAPTTTPVTPAPVADPWRERVVAGLDKMNEQHGALMKLLSEQHERVMSSQAGAAGAPKLMARIGESVDQLEATIKKADPATSNTVLEYTILNPYNYIRK